MKRKLLCGAALSLSMLLGGVASATEASIEGGIYSPNYDTRITKNGYYIEGSMSLFDVNKNVSIVGSGGYAKSGTSNGWSSVDYSAGVGIKGTYQVQARTFLTGEVGGAYHILDIKDNGIKTNTIKGISPYVKVGVDYAMSKSSVIGIDFKKSTGKAKASSYGINFKTLF